MNTRYSVFVLFLLFAVLFFQVACASNKTEKHFDDEEYHDGGDDLGVASVSNGNKIEEHLDDEEYYDDDDLGVASFSEDEDFPKDEGLDWALKEKKPVCAYCRLPIDCESGNCYFGRCVLGGVHQPHSVRRCFRSSGGKIYKREECDRCRSHKQCDTNFCRFGRCLHNGVLRDLSIITCFKDSYIEKC